MLWYAPGPKARLEYELFSGETASALCLEPSETGSQPSPRPLETGTDAPAVAILENPSSNLESERGAVDQETEQETEQDLKPSCSSGE